jgi:putative addiction module killer protein
LADPAQGSGCAAGDCQADRRLAAGHFGDVRAVGEGVRELRLHIGPGYRVYFVERAGQIVILLCGGDKRSQDRDIDAAKTMARELKE